MCIAVFLWQAHPLYPFFLLHNRDEYHGRPTEPVAWWDNGEILGGRDGLAGGTWLACSRNGRIAFVTNVREVAKGPQPRSRGDLPVRFLESKMNPTEFAEEVVMEAHQYRGFNLILVDLCSKSMIYVTNRPKDDKALVSEVPPGIHVLSNASLDTPWPKAVLLRSNFEKFLEKYGTGELPAEDLADKLMTDMTKADKRTLPGIYSVEFEYMLSSIFVEANTEQGRYGTRSISAVSVKTSGEVAFYEKYLGEESWKEHTVSYMMEQVIISFFHY
ncbi:uncharacterized protein LOC115672828 isoform X3 [Syzygium oleosum]|uniref:uncharacterized protein LOC115672828 isoform X3 n=1 Tax=Syzygium oleosum TaxID=219896 RepID=UPI0024B9BB8A|nr:uncharacterized protein LOC115672828 isoform X3 [Syzygium oleosum]